MRTITTAERRARLGRRHSLARLARTVEHAVDGLVALHSSDPATVYLSARARVNGFARADLDDALYERRSLVRTLGMRRTIFVVARELEPVIDAACTKALGPPERRRLEGMLAAQGVTREPETWVHDLSARTLKALRARGEASAVELSRDVPELATKLTFGEGKSWGGQVGVSTRMLFLLAAEGKVLRARPRGGWTSGAYRWSTPEIWLGERRAKIPHADACAQLLTAYLRAFGPATTTDLRWWTGWTARQTTATLERIDAVEVGLEDDATAWVMADDTRAVRAPSPWAALLPGLDPTVMGWKVRDWYLGPHAEALFDRNGNAGPTVMVNGRVVGAWAQRADGEVAFALLEDVAKAERSLIDTERRGLQTWLGQDRLQPRFRTPLERTLTA